MQLIQKYYMPWYFPLRKEFAGILFIVLIFLWFPWLSRLVDVTSAPIDPGCLQRRYPGQIGHAGF